MNVPCQQQLAERQTCIHLNCRFRRAEAFTIEPRPIEAANASLPGSEHRAGIVDPTRASLWPLGGGDPVIQSLRAMGVMFDHKPPAFRAGGRAFPRTGGPPGSGSFPRRA